MMAQCKFAIRESLRKIMKYLAAVAAEKAAAMMAMQKSNGGMRNRC
jgi:hypothetical protein